MNRKRPKLMTECQPSLPSFASFSSTFPSLESGCGIASVLDAYCVLSHLASKGCVATLCAGSCFHYFLTEGQSLVCSDPGPFRSHESRLRQISPNSLLWTMQFITVGPRVCFRVLGKSESYARFHDCILRMVAGLEHMLFTLVQNVEERADRDDFTVLCWKFPD